MTGKGLLALGASLALSALAFVVCLNAGGALRSAAGEHEPRPKNGHPSERQSVESIDTASSGLAAHGPLSTSPTPIRQPVEARAAAVLVRDCFGAPARVGRALFASANHVVSEPLDRDGRCMIPPGEWTHVLAVVPLHSPMLRTLNGLDRRGSQIQIDYGPPTLLCQILNPEGAVSPPRLWLDDPWEERGDWPMALRKSVPLVERVFLPLDVENQSVFFCGQEGMPATLSVDDPYLIETGNGLVDSVTLSQDKNVHALTLRLKPTISVQLATDQVEMDESLFSITVTFTGEEGTTLLAKRDGVAIGDSIDISYHPRYSRAQVEVQEIGWGSILATVGTRLPATPNPILVNVHTDRVRFTVVDSFGTAIEGAHVAQQGGALARTDSSGEASIRVSASGDDVVVLAAGYDIVEVPLARALSGGLIKLAPATGIRLQLVFGSSMPRLDGVGLALEDVEVRGVASKCRTLIQKAFGLEIASEDSGAMVFSLASSIDGVNPTSSADYVLASIFDVARTTLADLVIFDAFGQEALRQPLELQPGQLTHVVVNASERFKTYAGRVLDSQGYPIAAADVWAGGWGGMIGTVTTGSDGRFSLLVSADCNSITIDSEGYVSYSGPWPPEGSSAGADVQLRPSRSIRVQVVDQSGARVPGVALLLRSGSLVWAGHETSAGHFEFSSVPQDALQAEIRLGEDSWVDRIETKVADATIKIAR